MSYIKFDKTQLVNLEYSLQKELLRSNRAGSYASTTITGCNTRKYHGLLVTLQPQLDNQHHVFLSSLDVTVIQREAEFNLGIHKYMDDIYEPAGHQYIMDFESDPIPKVTHRVGGVIISTERLFAARDDRILIRYTLKEANSPTKIRFTPLLAFRSVHTLSVENEYANKEYEEITNGIKVRMYENYSPLYMQFSKKNKYFHNPDWYYGIEYTKENSRGYYGREDLFVPGCFEVPMKKGESVIFAAGLKVNSPARLKTTFANEVNDRIPRDSFENCLKNAAQQFLVHNGSEVYLIAGYHWFNESGRDTFAALPGLLLTQEGDTNTFLAVVDTMVSKMHGPFFPGSRIGSDMVYNAVDAPLWFVWALQQYVIKTGNWNLIYQKYAKCIEKILDGFRKGTSFNIIMLDNGLLSAGADNDVLTWMNTVIDGIPVVNRNGLAVEINALWYNSIKFYIELNAQSNVKKNAQKWKSITNKIDESYTDTFWDEKNEYLADVVRGEHKDFSVRPNQLIATSLPYSPLTDELKHKVLTIVEQELLTPKGIRTLSPKSSNYKGAYQGNIIERDKACHQGSAFPWLLGHFSEGYLRIHGKGGLAFIKNLYKGFEEEMHEAGIGTLSELHYGDPPFKGKAAISQAWSVAELLRINDLIKLYEQNTI